MYNYKQTVVKLFLNCSMLSLLYKLYLCKSWVAYYTKWTIYFNKNIIFLSILNVQCTFCYILFDVPQTFLRIYHFISMNLLPILIHG